MDFDDTLAARSHECSLTMTTTPVGDEQHTTPEMARRVVARPASTRSVMLTSSTAATIDAIGVHRLRRTVS